jgi:hypothetical protein
VRRVVLTYRRAGSFVDLVAFVCAVYLAATSLLKSVKVPDEATWQPPRVWFWLMLVSALVVPLFALLKALDAREERRDKEQAQAREEQSQLDADMARICQTIASVFSRHCDHLRLDDMAMQVWLCDEETGLFDRRWRFFLPFDRKASGIAWGRGVGIAGSAWQQDRDLAVDLSELRQLPRGEFDRLPDKRKYGMTYENVRSSSAYTGIIAVRLFSEKTADTLLGMLVIDYTGQDAFDCMEAALEEAAVSQVIGWCARRLADATFLREEQA